MKPTTQPRYMALSYVRALFDFAFDKQLPLTPLLDVFGLHISQLDDHDLLLNSESIDSAFALLEQLTGDENVGLRIGQRMRPAHLGVMGLLLMSCTHSHQLFDLHRRYSLLISNATSPDYATWNDNVCMQLNGHEGRDLSRHRLEYNLGGWTQMARWLLGSEFSITRIEFSHKEPDNIAEQLSYFGCPLSFDHEFTRVYFPIDHYDAKLGFFDSELNNSLEREARKRLTSIQGRVQNTDAFLEQLRKFISDKLPHGVPELSLFAKENGSSVRSIQRRLDAMGSGYKAEVEAVRRDLSYRHLHNPSLTLVDIAFMLGFSDQSAFQKAFKRWHNCAPGEYRRQLQKGAQDNNREEQL